VAGAAVVGVRATRRKSAARRQVNQVGNSARDGLDVTARGGEAGNADDVVPLACSSIVTLSAGDGIMLIVKNIDDTSNPTMECGHIVLWRIPY